MFPIKNGVKQGVTFELCFRSMPLGGFR